MYIGVFLHVGLLVKPFAAVLAWIRTRVGMNEQVRGQGARPLETLAALLALEYLYAKIVFVIMLIYNAC